MKLITPELGNVIEYEIIIKGYFANKPSHQKYSSNHEYMENNSRKSEIKADEWLRPDKQYHLQRVSLHLLDRVEY